MFELMAEGPPIVAVIGPTLSAELTVVGQITPYYDVVQVYILIILLFFLRLLNSICVEPEGRRNDKRTCIKSQVR